jgi:hypothetical protein
MFSTTEEEPLFATGLQNISGDNIQAVLCIQSKFYDNPVYNSTAEAALQSLDPNNFYSRAANLHKNWEAEGQS